MSFCQKFLISYHLLDCYTCLTLLPSSLHHSYNYSSAYYVITLWRVESMKSHSAVYSDPLLPPSFVQVFILTVLSNIISLYFCGATSELGPSPPPSFLMFTHHTHARTHPIGLLCTSDQLVADVATYTTHNIHNWWTSLPSAGYEPAISRFKSPHVYSLYRTAIGIGKNVDFEDNTGSQSLRN